jgi:hypothetical protein
MSRIRLAIVTAVALLSAAPALAADKKAVEAKLTSAKETYSLNAAQSGEAFRKAMKDQNARPQPASKVDLKFTITNNTEKDFTFDYGGDATQIKFTLKGPGAITVEPAIAMTMEFRMGTPTTIKPGKSFEIPISALAGGARGISQLSFFTEPGDYTLSATLHYTQGENPAQLTSDELKFKVEK